MPNTRAYTQVWPTEFNGLGLRPNGVLPTMRIKNPKKTKTKRKKK